MKTQIPNETPAQAKLDYEMIVLKYRQSLVHYVARMANDSYVAEDIAQDTFMKLYSQEPTFASENSLQSWLYTVARNAALDFLRRKKHATAPMHDNVPAPTEEERQTDMEARESRGKVESAVRKLTRAQRMVLQLREVDRRTYREIGHTLNRSIGGVRSLLVTAKRTLRKHLVQTAPVKAGMESLL